MGHMGHIMDKNKALKVSNDTLDQAIEQMASEVCRHPDSYMIEENMFSTCSKDVASCACFQM